MRTVQKICRVMVLNLPFDWPNRGGYSWGLRALDGFWLMNDFVTGVRTAQRSIRHLSDITELGHFAGGAI
jgi:hypothetical protein